MVSATDMMEVIRAHRRRRALFRALLGTCCAVLLGYLIDRSGPEITVPGKVVAYEPGKERPSSRRLANHADQPSGAVRIETEHGTFSWTGSSSSADVWVDGVVGRVSGFLHVHRVRPRERK